MRAMKSRWRLGCFLVLSLAWMIVIFCFSAQPDTQSSLLSGRFSYRIVRIFASLFGMEMTESALVQAAAMIDFPIRKCAHMSEYALLAMLYFGITGNLLEEKRGYQAAFLGAVFYACTDEFHQLFVPGRAGRLLDVCIDAIGAVCGLGFLFMIQWFIKKIRKR